MKNTVRSLASDRLFPFEQCFEEGLPQQQLRSELQQKKLQTVIEDAELTDGSSNVFMDCSTSKSRNPEAATHVLTCVRPSHQIYSNQLQRFVLPREMWTNQGMWKNDFPNPSAVDDFWKSDTDTQDMAGQWVAKSCACINVCMHVYIFFLYLCICKYISHTYIYVYIKSIDIWLRMYVYIYKCIYI